MRGGHEESALLLRCPAAEPAVAVLAGDLDRAAAVGVPAHVDGDLPLPPSEPASPPPTTRRLAACSWPCPVFTLTGTRHGVVR